jgi:hypothetical protein
LFTQPNELRRRQAEDECGEAERNRDDQCNRRCDAKARLDVYSEAMTWRHPAELATWLSNLDPPQLARHANQSRAYYEAHHRPELLRAAIHLAASGRESTPPARPEHVVDRLQAYLDDCQTYWTRSGRKIAVTDEDIQALDEKWRHEIERVREETIRFMTIPVRSRRVLSRVISKLRSFTRG